MFFLSLHLVHLLDNGVGIGNVNDGSFFLTAGKDVEWCVAVLQRLEIQGGIIVIISVLISPVRSTSPSYSERDDAMFWAGHVFLILGVRRCIQSNIT
jgi:hypothetical protein